jgi:Zn-dependent protease
MQSGGIRVGRIGGAPVVLTWSWVLVAVILTAAYTPQLSAVLGPGRGVAVAAGFVVLLFASVFLHELAHGLVARARGIGVREYALTFFGGHTAFERPLPTPGTAALVAFAGPATNLVLGGACWALGHAVGSRPGVAAAYVAVYAYSGWVTNLFVGLFNLIPALPLDGGALLEALVWRLSGHRSTGRLAAGWVGVGAGAAIIVWALLRARAAGGFNLADAVWPLLIGFTVIQGAWASVQAARRERSLAAVTLAGHIRPAVAADAATPLTDVAAELRRGTCVVVTEGGAPAGYVDPAALDHAARGTSGTAGTAGTATVGIAATGTAATPISAAMIAFPKGLGVPADAAGAQLAALMAHAGQVTRVVPVVDGHQLVGVVDPSEVFAG